MKNNLLSIIALCGATLSTMPLWAATEWEDPTVKTTVIDLETEGTYFVYHPASKMFMTNGNSYGTQLSLGKTGKKIVIKKDSDERFGVEGWTMEMPDAEAYNGGKPKYLWVLGNGSAAFVDFNLQADGHYIWKITKNDNADTYRIKMPDEDPTFGLEAQDGLYANAFAGWDNAGYDPADTITNTVVLPLIDTNTAGYENAMLDWAFVTEEDYAVFEAKKTLKASLENAVEKNYNGSLEQFETIYNSTTATSEEILNAQQELDQLVYEYQLSLATEENPIDMTFKMSNPSFENGWSGWVSQKDPVSGQDNFQVQNQSHPTSDGADFSKFFERWVPNSPQPNWQLLQEVKDLPNGKYKITAHVLTNTETPAGIFVIGDGGAGEERVEATNSGVINGTVTAQPYSVTFNVVTGQATVGFRVINTNCNWTGVDNFKLEYLGKSANFAIEGLQKTIDDAIAYQSKLEDEQAKYSQAGFEKFATDLQFAKDALNNPELDEDSLIAIRLILINRMDSLAEDVKIYQQIRPLVNDKLDTYINNYEPYAELSDTNPDAFIGLWDYTDQILEAYENGTFDPGQFSTLSAQIDSIFKKDVRDMLHSGMTDDAYGLLSSPDFTNNSVSGWNGGAASANELCEQYFGSAGSQSFDVYQEIDNIPVGAYKITMKGFYRPAWYQEIIDGWEEGSTKVVYSRLYGNDNAVAVKHIFDGGSEEPYIVNDEGETADMQIPVIDNKYVATDRNSAGVAFERGEYMNEIICVAPEGKLRFGVKMTNPNGLAGSWTAFDEFRVTYLGNDAGNYIPTVQSLYDQTNETYIKISSNEFQYTADVPVMLEKALQNANAVISNPDIEKALASVAEMKEAIAYAERSIQKIKELNDMVNDMYNNRCPEYENTIENIDFSDIYNLCDIIMEKIYLNEIESIAAADQYMSQLNKGCTEEVQNKLCEGATKDDPKDLTKLIVNPGFSVFDLESGVETNSAKGWNIKVENNMGWASNTANYSAYEFYNNSKFDLYQTFFGLAPGFYKLECNGFYRSGSAQEAAENYRDNEEDIRTMLYAGMDSAENFKPFISIIEDGTENPTASENINVAEYLSTEENPIKYWFVPNAMSDAQGAFSAGLYKNEMYFEVKEGQEYAKIGVKKLEGIQNDWTIFDSFKLYYLGAGEENKPDGILNTEEKKATILHSRYYTIGGELISKPTKRGFYIRVDEMSDETSRTLKFMLR